MMNSRWIVVACFLTFACAQPKPETVVKPAKIISSSCAHPAYPAEAARAGQTGKVALRFFIDSEGTVTSTSIDKSSGFPTLDNAAASALGKCHFEPAVKEGIEVESEAEILYVWKLEGPDPRESPPKMITSSCQPPRYESEGDGEGKLGTVQTMVSVDSTGTVTNVELKKSSGSFRVDNAVLQSLQTCRFQPAMSKGTPVDAMIQFEWKPEN